MVTQGYPDFKRSTDVNLAGQSVAVDVSAATVNIAVALGYVPPGLTALLASGGPVNIAAGASVNLFANPVDVLAYPAFNLAVKAHCGSQGTAGAALSMRIVLTWFSDAAGTDTVATETQWIWLGNSTANATTAYGGGMHHGRYWQVTAVVPAVSTVTCTVDSFEAFGTARTINTSESSWKQGAPGGMNSGLSMLNTPFTGDDALLSGVQGVTLAANATQWLPLPLGGTRRIWTRLEVSQTLAHDAVLAHAITLTNGSLLAGTGTSGVLYNVTGTGGTSYTAELGTPRAPLYLVVSATATASVITWQVASIP